MKPLRTRQSRLITLLETVTGVTAPERNKFATLLHELIRQRNMFRRERNRANAEVIRSRRAARRLARRVLQLEQALRDAQTFRGNLSTKSEDAS
jgi:hypothetical protein